MNELFSARTFLLLARRWTWLAAAAGLAVVAAFLVTALQPQEYTASVNVVPKRARTEVNYDTRIRTVSADGAAQGQGGQVVLPLAVSAERRQALAQLVRDADIERAVRQELGDQLPAELRAPGRLMRLVQGKVAPRSEVIVIQVNAPSAALVEQIAPSWARAYERQVNQLYATSTSGTLKLESELGEARQKYQTAEEALTSFVASTPQGEQTRLLEGKQNLLRELMASRQAMVVDLHKVAHRVDLLVGQAEALQQQLAAAQDNSAAASNALALTLLKTQAFASSMSLPASLQLQVPAPEATGTAPGTNAGTTPASDPQQRHDLAATARALQDWSLPANLQVQVPAASTPPTLAQQRADVAATIQVLQDWRDRMRQEIQSRSSDSAGGGTVVETATAELAQAIAQLEAEVRELQGKVAEQTARHKNLQLERDVAWESYTSLTKKAEEARVASVVGAGNEVSLASQSVVAEPKSKRLALVLPLAGVLGVMAGASWILLREHLAPVYGQLAGQLAAQANGRAAPGTVDSVAPRAKETAESWQ